MQKNTHVKLTQSTKHIKIILYDNIHTLLLYQKRTILKKSKLKLPKSNRIYSDERRDSLYKY